MSKRIRIKDIALKAGVSKGTVDRVLHNRGNVSPDARKKVVEAMEELSYEPNVIASALASNRTWKIAVLIPDNENDPFWEQPLSGIKRARQALRDYGVVIDVYLFRDADPPHFKALGDQILEGQYDGLLISPSFVKEGHEFLNKCMEQELCYIQINTYLERSDPSFLAYIGQDSYSSGVLAAKLLNFGMEKGATAMILHMEKEVYNAMHLIDKEKGFRNFFYTHPQKNIQILNVTYGDVFDKEGLHELMRDNFENHPKISGIFVTTSKLFHLVPILKNLQKEHIKLVGFDLIPSNLNCLYEDSIHFLINQNPYKQGFLGIMNLFNHMVLKKSIKKLQMLPLDVVMRENVQYYLEDKHEKLHIII
ncbi:MAG: LacI family DNA-binding transcriptional regulator [Bacteroidota bacterium]